MNSADQQRRSDNARWVRATAIIGAMIGALMVVLGMEPRLALVAVIVVLVAAVAWLISGLSGVAEPLKWYVHGSAAYFSARPDTRVQLLTARLRHNTRHARRQRVPTMRGDDDADTQPADEIVRSLVSVLDDHLREQRGVDRAVDPAAAHDALGAELTNFVNDPAAARAMTQRRALESTIARIEAFTSSTDLT